MTRSEGFTVRMTGGEGLRMTQSEGLAMGIYAICVVFQLQPEHNSYIMDRKTLSSMFPITQRKPV